MRLTRVAGQGDLARLLELYRHLNAAAPPLAADRGKRIFDEILADRNVALFVSLAGDTMVASCFLVTAPNLMRGGAPHGFLENVVTHADHRRQGHGQATIDAALQEAWRRGCHQVLLVTGRGRADPHVHDFYQSCGFEQRGKTAFVALRH
jgi:GNAT superfamily N-acetyltransferase